MLPRRSLSTGPPGRLCRKQTAGSFTDIQAIKSKTGKFRVNETSLLAWSFDRAALLAVNMFAVIAFAKFGFEKFCIFSRPRFNAENDAALFDSGFINLRSFLRYPPADQGSDKAACDRASTGTGQGRDDGSGDD